MKKRKIKINKDLGQYKAGKIITVQCHDDGQPVDVFWRRRLKDSKIDGCVEWYKPETPVKAAKKKQGKSKGDKL